MRTFLLPFASSKAVPFFVAGAILVGCSGSQLAPGGFDATTEC